MSYIILNMDFYSRTLPEVFQYLQSDKNGLSSKEAQKRFTKYGINQIGQKKGKQAFTIFISQLQDWLVIILIFASIISFSLGERIDSLVILSIVFLSVIFGFIQEYHAEKTLENLKKFITHHARVLRDGIWQEIKSSSVTCGDIIKLRIGDRVPADLRIIETDELAIDESMLTGESFPGTKSTEVINKSNIPLLDQKNMAFAGTFVAQGMGTGVVVAIGNDSYLGQIAKNLEAPTPPTDFQKQIKHFSRFLFKVIIILTVFVFAANALLGKGYLDSFLFAVALAVGITPELLPMIVTVTLSHGALKLAKNKVIAKKLISVEDLGNIDTLCADKTGTLTEGKFSLSKLHPYFGIDKDGLLLHALVCTSNFSQKGTTSANMMDKSLWESDLALLVKDKIKDFEFLDENEFDFQRRRSSVLVKNGRKLQLLVKGSVDSILSVCGKIDRNFKLKIDNYEKEGFRVILLAGKKLQKTKSSLNDEKDLTLEGALLFSDPVKKDAADSLRLFERLGVRIKIISGDSALVVQKIARDLNIVDKNGKIIIGDDLDGLSEIQMENIAEKYSLFARITPQQKERIVASLNKEGHIVGFLGDGVNDALALRAADVGISVNTGSEVAKDAADIVLLEKNLTRLGNGIEEGRRTFGNITKYILNTISANFGNMATVALSSLFLPFIPLLPGQILLNNFISDIPLLAIATDNVDPGFVKKPKRWNIKMISKAMVYFGLISSFYDFATILPLLYIAKISPAGFRTAWFIESAISEMLVTFAIRSRLPFYKSRPSHWLILLTFISFLFIIIIPSTSLGNYLFDFVLLPFPVFAWIALVLTLYFATTELAKSYFFKLFA